MASCGANSSLNSAPHSSSSTFAVTLENGSSSFTPQVSVSNDSTGAVVTISTTGAQTLTAAYMHLSYDSSKYTPSTVDFGTMLGTGSQVLTLALTNRAGDVPVGIVQVPSSGVDAASGAGTLATVHFTAQPFARSVSSVGPVAPVNKVSDLAIIGQDTQGVTLRWTERHPGDTDNNGEVNLSDLSNIGKYLNQVVQDAPDPLAASLADCNGDGTVTIAELTTLGQNFGSTLSGYTLFTDAAMTTKYGNGQLIGRSNFYDPSNSATKNHPVVYTFTALNGGGSPVFSVAPLAEADLVHLGPQSNVATSVVVTGPPDAPTNLVATGSAAIGSGKIKLTWVDSAAADVAGYAIERKLTNPDGPFTEIATVPGTATSYVDSDAALTAQTYGYQIRAVDVTTLYSDYTATATAAPYFLPAPSAPINFTAVSSVPFGSAVDLAWAAPADGTALRFRIFREAPGESTFTPIKTTQNALVTSMSDINLTPQADYKYYVVSVGASNVVSPPTATLTATSSEAAAILITGITIDKLTHLKAGTEAAANIVVTTDKPFDSLQFTGPGTFTANATGGTWKPNATTPVGKNTLSFVAVKGPKSSAPSEVYTYVTTETIKTQFGTSGHYKDDFNHASEPQLPSVLAPTAPLRPLSYYANKDHVVFYNTWGVWCYWCKWELGDVQKLQDYYGADGFQYVGDDDQSQAIEPISTIVSFYTSKGYTGFESYVGLDPAWASYGFNNAWPTSILIDRDGMIRLQVAGALGGTDLVHWSTTVSELTGKTPAKTSGFDN